MGVAKTEIKEPVSEYATALESIAGPAEAADPSKKFGASLEPLTGDTAPTAGIAATAAGVVESVSATAGSAVESLKQVSPKSEHVGVSSDQLHTQMTCNGCKMLITCDLRGVICPSPIGDRLRGKWRSIPDRGVCSWQHHGRSDKTGRSAKSGGCESARGRQLPRDRAYRGPDRNRSDHSWSPCPRGSRRGPARGV